MGRKPHVMVVPFPAQGHVAPLMKLAYNLAGHGIKVTFVNTESIHVKLTSAMSGKFKEQSPICLVSIPEGLEPNHDGKDIFEAIENASIFMPGHLQTLIENIKQLNDDDQVTHVVADISVGWALETAEKMGIKRAAFVPYGAGNLALILHNPMLIEAGIIDVHGKK